MIILHFFFLLGHYKIGAAAYYFSFLFDCMDGKVARMKNLYSEFGRKLDYYSDVAKKFIILVCIIVNESIQGSNWAILCVLTAVYYAQHRLHKDILLKKTGGYDKREHFSYQKILLSAGYYASLYSYIDRCLYC